MKRPPCFVFISLAIIFLSSLTLLLLTKSLPPRQQSALPIQHRKTHRPAPENHDQHAEKNKTEANENTEKKTPSQAASTVESPSKGLRDAFQSALELWGTNPGLATAKLHDIAKELGNGDPKWTEFYHLLGHSIVEKPPGAPKGAYLTLEDAKRYYLLKNELIGLSEDEKTYAKELQASLRWNKEGKQVGQLTQPIRDVLDWMKENAPPEWDTVNTHFWVTLPSRNAPPTTFSEENWRTVDERVDIQYDTFFEALELLPENSLTLQTLYGSSHSVAEETLYSGQKKREVQPPPTDTPQPHTHTWDSVHEMPVQVGDISPESQGSSPPPPANLASDTDPQIDFESLEDLQGELPGQENLGAAFEDRFSPERFNRAMSTLKQYGSKEGLRRLKNGDPELAEQIEKHLKNVHNKY